MTLAVVADRVVATGPKPSSWAAEDWLSGMRELHTSGVVFECLTGNVSFDAHQERFQSMVLLIFQPNSFSRLG